MTTPSCISCGMPLRTPADHAAGDVGKPYCRHCARPDGSMKSFDECVVGMVGFLTRTQGVAEDVARETARTMLARMPAWKDHA